MPSMRQLIVFFCCLGLPLAQAAEPVPLGGRPIVTLQRSGGAPVRLTLSDLEALPSETLEAQLPGEANARWQGVRLSLLLRHLDLAPPKRLRVLALNDYSAIIPYSDLDSYQPILAYRRNGAYMAIRERGPLFIIYPMARYPELRNQVYYNRTVWQVSSITLEYVTDMTVPLLDPTKLRRQRQIMGLLLGLVLLMALIAGAALWLAVRQAQQLAQPNLHNELWQTYSLRAELDRTLDAARHTESGEGQADDLAIRLEVLASLIAPLRRQSLFRHLAEPRPEVQATLQRLIELSDRWSDQAPWGDPVAARRLAAEIVQQVPPLLEPTHQIVVASNIALTNQLDVDRKRLHRAFYALFWALLGIGAGGALLVLRLVADFKRAQQLAGHLIELNATLEKRVGERTRQLSEGKALLHFILEASPSDVVLLSACGASIHYVSPRLLKRLGCQAQDDFNLPRLFASTSEYSRLQNALEARGQVDGWEAQLCGETPCWAVICARHLEIDGEPATLIWCYDISRRKAMEQELRLLASTDTLTGLHNRHSFLHQAELMLKAAERFRHPCVALMLDIDHFKNINDSHGHLTGDRALQRVAETLRQGLREVDLLGRLGGEEFAALLPEVSLDQALDVAERLRAGVEALRVNNPDGEPLRMTVSIGVALRRDAGDDLESLLVRADSALYQAKSGGRNRTEYAPA